MNRSTQFEAELGAVRGSLFEGLTLEALELRPAARPDAVLPDESQPTVAIDRVHLSLDLTRLFEQRLVIIDSLVIDGVSLQIERSDEQRWQLVGMPNQPPEIETGGDEPLRVEVRQVEIRNAEVAARWQSPIGPGHLVARGSMSTHDIIWPDEGGNTLPASFAASLQLTDGGLGPLHMSSGRVTLNATPGHLRVDLQRASGGGVKLGQFHVSGSAMIELGKEAPSISTIDAHLGFTEFDLAEIDSLYETAEALPPTNLNGDLRIDISQAKDSEDRASASEGLDLRFELSLDPSHVQNLAIDSARARLSYQTGSDRWTLSEVEVAALSSKLEGEAAGTLRSLERLSLDAFELPIEDVAKALGYEWTGVGSFDVAARLSGPIDDPLGHIYLEGAVGNGERPTVEFSLDLNLRGDRRFRLEDLTVGAGGASDLQFVSSSPSEIYNRNDTWVLSDLHLRGLTGDLRITEARTNGREHQLELELDELSLLPLSEFLWRDIPVEGNLSGPLAIALTAEQTRIDTDLVWQDPAFAGLSADRIEFRVQSSEASLGIELEIESDGTSPARVSARLPTDELGSGLAALASDRDFALEVSLHELPARHLARLFLQEQDPDEIFAGTLSGEFRADGSNAGLQVQGDLDWIDARLGTAVADDVNLKGRTEAGALLLNLKISHEGRSGFLAEASIDLANWLERPDAVLRDPSNNATLRAEKIDLGWLVPRASARRLGRIEEVRGHATGQLSVKGSPEGPNLNGELRIDNARLQLALLDERVGPIHGHLIFSNQGVQVERIEIESKRGPAIVTGHYRWGADGRDDLRLETRFEKFALTHFPLLDARVSGNLDLSGSLGALNATGDLDFEHVQINLPAPEDPLFREVRILGLEKSDSVETAALQSPRPSAYQSAQAEIAIDVRSGARIRQRGADLQVEGKFRLRKKRMSPTLLQGSLRTTYGTYTFLGRRFDVSEAIATFNERNPPDPDVHLVATRQFGDVTVGVETSGRWSEPESRLISTPEMDDSEILSYLVFDKPIDEIGQRNDNRLNAAVAQMAGNMALSQLSRALSEELPINEISMGVNEDMTVATIGVETSVGDDIIVRYDRALQAGTGDRVTVEWRFWKNFSLRSEYANGDTSGLDVFWSYEY
ncbi:MAG: translocation/assembly module TamB domain-containing protein [Deltaproteobacteria bacterium]|nr:translocation/assembly module TamB domain-containing protein [Deltaproteobacteria bacterium]